MLVSSHWQGSLNSVYMFTEEPVKQHLLLDDTGRLEKPGMTLKGEPAGMYKLFEVQALSEDKG